MILKGFEINNHYISTKYYSKNVLMLWFMKTKNIKEYYRYKDYLNYRLEEFFSVTYQMDFIA
jgi:hypothetical protein